MKHHTKNLLLLTVATISLLPTSTHGALAAEKPKLPAAQPMKQAPPMAPEEFRKQEDWRLAIANVPKPTKGCFTATFPSKEWKEVACVASPDFPMVPKQGAVPLIIGNSNDIAARVPAGNFISSAIGSFDTLTNVNTISGPIANSGPSVANAYTLQLNTDFFASTACSGSPNPGCQGWAQYVYFSNGSAASAFIQYWLIRYNTTCPGGVGWNQFSFSGSSDIYCWKNNQGGAIAVPVQGPTNLGQVTLTGTATATGDSVTVTAGNTAYTRVGDNAVNAAAGWTTAEFNIFGAGGNSSGGGMVSFNNTASVTTRTRVNYGGTAAPTCVAQGFTGETNNLSFGPGAPMASGLGPAVIFNESIAGGSPTNCAASVAIGDTHLTTLSGLMYDFQAQGDFELLQTASGFLVQNRQVSGAPNWPDASVNSAVATIVGKSQVAVCSKPQRLVVDGKTMRMRNGLPRLLADGTQILLLGNSYLIRGPNGDWVRADVLPTHIDVKVGVGEWPIKAEGLLVNADGNPNVLSAKNGKTIRNPFRFEDMYGFYGDSWRVDPRDSMLNVCGKPLKPGIPKRPFVSTDLKPEILKRAQTACLRRGVKEGPLFEACVIDVAMLGRAAARVHATTPPPAAVGQYQ